MQALRFTGPFAFLLSIPLLYRLSPAAPLLTPAAILLTLLVLEQLGRVGQPDRPTSKSFGALPITYIPLQLGAILWAAGAAVSVVSFIALAISVGVCTGVFGMLAAHEMVHSPSRWKRRLGSLMLLGMSYPHFRVAHLHGHHRYAATERDASTARLGESFYRFLLRTIPAQVLVAWRFETRRTGTRPLSLAQNRVVQDVTMLILIYATLFMFQPKYGAFLVAESAVAILVLELFNYVAHYGLVRRTNAASLEPLADRHSWNSSGLGNFLLFNMGRHSDHHRNPAISYEELRPVAHARELPYGYAGAIVLALAPPLWRAIMDHRIEPVAMQSSESGYSGESPAAAMP